MAGRTLGIVAKVLVSVEKISGLAQEAQFFKHRSQRLADRIVDLLAGIEIKSTAGSERSDPTDVPGTSEPDAGQLLHQSLEDLLLLVKGIEALLRQLDEANFFAKDLKRGTLGRQFDEFSEELAVLSWVIRRSFPGQASAVRHGRLEEAAKDQEEDVRDIQDNLSKLTKGQGVKKRQLEDVLKSLKEQSTEAESSISKYHGAEDGLKEIDKHQLLTKKEISTGRFGQTYKAVYMMERVVLKSFSIGDGNSETKSVFLNEARDLLQFESSHVVRLWGVCTEQAPYLVVLEYMAQGSLRHVLDVEGSKLTWERRVQMALGGALGLYQTHVIPRPSLRLTITSHSFLVAENWTVKISGVGFSETKSAILKSKLNAPGTSEATRIYDSPEILENNNTEPDVSTDVYSFGIVMWEIATGLKPYEGYTDDEIVNLVVHNKGKLSLALFQECPTGFTEVIDKCRDFDPTMRPKSSGIVDRLQKLRSGIN